MLNKLFVNMSRSENKEYFNYNVVNKNPNEHQQSENISREVDELNKKIDSLENTTTNLDDKELQNVTTEKDKKVWKDVDLEKPKTKVNTSKRLSYLKQKINSSADMSKYILKRRDNTST